MVIEETGRQTDRQRQRQRQRQRERERERDNDKIDKITPGYIKDIITIKARHI